ncbi:MAG: molybdopterin molybdotransferase MoeA [Lachnospiraceae bacterium]|nr:molybdopterin molybdotransferase MoeA [Lachnospiraceae bacterium]
MDYREAVKLLSGMADPVGTQEEDLSLSFGRILGADIKADENVPSFDRSPYDGYAFRADDTKEASKGHPVTLKVIENIRAGQMPRGKVKSGTAVRLMTGAPIPAGADAVCKYEDTDFTDDTVSLRECYSPGENIVTAGEDIRKGTTVAKKGYPVDAGTAGTLASLGHLRVCVYKRPVAGILATGDEVTDPEKELLPGKIRNSNRFIMAAALKGIGFDTVYLGQADDTVEDIGRLILKGYDTCDVIISTGGVSAGDYDLVPDAMEGCGYEILARGVGMKPGMACAYGMKEKKLMLALSGNPASALTNLQCVCYPALKKMAGYAVYDHQIVHFKTGQDILKTGGGTRFVRGRTLIRDGQLILDAPSAQGNVVISSAVGCDAYGVLSGVKAPVMSGSDIEGFFV